MPFTPFHLGPAALFKGIGGERFSFMIFGGSQVLMDIEPLVRMIRDDAVLHGISHTVAGAFGIAIASAVVGRPLSNLTLRHTGIGDRSIGWKIALVSAFIGTYSHIVLDAIMHTDMNPFWPIAYGNALLGTVSVRALHLLCVGSALLGGILIWLRSVRESGARLSR